MLDDLRALFVSTYELKHEPSEIAADEPLFGVRSRFGLDSMDTLKFIAVVHNQFGLDIGSTNTETFRTLAGIAQTISADRAVAEGR